MQLERFQDAYGSAVAMDMRDATAAAITIRDTAMQNI
jgi:hypothetical protein